MDPNSKSYQTDKPHELRAQLPRRRVLGGLAVAGVATSLIAACDDKAVGGSSGGSGGLNTDNSVKGATEATKAANQKLLDSLPFSEKADFGIAKRGLTAQKNTLTT